uniref:Uncharacterized protein n=1 Tax=Arundo donax TaxID=35708 RepID=A0A0A9D2I7_ARUDO
MIFWLIQELASIRTEHRGLKRMLNIKRAIVFWSSSFGLFTSTNAQSLPHDIYKENSVQIVQFESQIPLIMTVC